MRITFWGVRGSIPAPPQDLDYDWRLRRILALAAGRPLAESEERDAFIRSLPGHLRRPVGGNTPCVEVSAGNDRVILDGGSGLRMLGQKLGRNEPFGENDLYLALETGQKLSAYGRRPPEKSDLDLTLLFSHTHWDHIQGWPFFPPAYVPGNRLSLYGRDGGELAEALALQQRAPSMFPIALENMGAAIGFHTFPAEGLWVGGLEIDALELPHPGGSLVFRLRAEGRTVVYATDYELKPLSESAARFREFIRGADVLISDTQYTYLEGVAREGWGHSTSFDAMDMAIGSGVRAFFLFHHDPEHSDAKLYDSLEKTRAYHTLMSGQGEMRVDLATEGLTVII